MLLFNEINCEGRSGRYYSNTDMTKAEYTLDDMYYGGIGNDTVSSVMIPYGYTVELW